MFVPSRFCYTHSQLLLSPFCHLHVIFLFAELVIQCAGFYALYGPSPFQISVYCSSSSSGSSNGSDSTTTTTTTAIVNTSSINLIYMVVYWSFIAATIWILILALFLYLSKKRRRYTNFHKYHELWKSRLDWIFSYFKIKVTNGKDVMTDVAGELADYFKDVDWAPSDIVAGLILVKRKQKRDRDEMLERRRLMAQLKGCSPYHGGTSSARSSMEMYQSPTFRFPPALPVPTTSASSPSFVFVSSSYSPAAAGESPTGHVHSQQSTRLPRIPSSTPPRDNNNPSSTTTTPRPAYRIEFPPIDIPKQVSSCVNTDQPTTTGLAKKLKHQPASTSLTPPPEQQQTQQLAPPHAIIIERANTSTSVTSAAVTTTHNAMDGFMSSPARSTPNQKDADTRSEILCKEDIPDILYFAKYMVKREKCHKFIPNLFCKLSLPLSSHYSGNDLLQQ